MHKPGHGLNSDVILIPLIRTAIPCTIYTNRTREEMYGHRISLRLHSKFVSLLTNPLPFAHSHSNHNTLTSFTKKYLSHRPRKNWEWLKDPKNERLQSFLKKEEKYLKHLRRSQNFHKAQEIFRHEFRHHLLQRKEKFSVPEIVGSFAYFVKTDRNSNFPIYLRRSASDAQVQTILDQNSEKLLIDLQQFSLVSSMKIDSQAEDMALIVLMDDHDNCKLLCKNILTREIIDLTPFVGPIRNVEWDISPFSFYYTSVDKAYQRPTAVYHFCIKTHTNTLVFEETDTAFVVDLSRSKDNAYIFIHSNSKDVSETHAISVRDRKSRLILVRSRDENALSFIDHASDRFYLVTNADSASNYKIMTSKSATRYFKWQTLVPEHFDVKIEDVDVFKRFLVLYERVKSIPRIRVIRRDKLCQSLDQHIVSLPKSIQICSILPGVNRNYTANSVRFSVSTPFIPEFVYDYDMDSRHLRLRQKTFADFQAITTKRKFASKDFISKREFVTGPAGEDLVIPLTLLHARGIERNSANPTLLIGYGAYGTNLDVNYEMEYLSLLSRGWIIALAHTRGGGELGLQWHQNGRGLSKENTFTDFYLCAKYLLEQKYTSPEFFAAKGISAGGLIMGVMANRFPQMFKALVMRVPFVDILDTMSDSKLPLTIHEYEEWGGDPATNSTVYKYIAKYAPCENVNVTCHGTFPSMFVTGSMRDYRVQYWEPAKWVYQHRQKLEADTSKSQDKPLLILNMSSTNGHYGASGQLEHLEESAIEFAFLYKALGLRIDT